MCDFFDKNRDDFERAKTHDDFKTIFVHQFNNFYEIEIDDVESWRELSRVLSIFSLFNDVEEAKEMSFQQDLLQIAWMIIRKETKLILECFENKSSRASSSILSTWSTQKASTSALSNSTLWRNSKITQFTRKNSFLKNLYMREKCWSFYFARFWTNIWMNDQDWSVIDETQEDLIEESLL